MSYLLWIDWRIRSSRTTTSSTATLEGAQTRILGTFLRLPCFRYCFWAYKIWMIRFTMTSDLPVPGTQLHISFLWFNVYSTYFTAHHTQHPKPNLPGGPCIIHTLGSALKQASAVRRIACFCASFNLSCSNKIQTQAPQK